MANSSDTPTDPLLDALRAELPEQIVSTDPEDLHSRAADLGPADHLTPQLPAAVVRPQTVAEVRTAVRLARTHGRSVVTRGAGTGLAGGANAVHGCLVLEMTGMDRIIRVSAEDSTATVEPGVIVADLDAAAAEHGLMYAPDPASWTISTIGGNIATNAGGLRCAKYGVTRDSVLSLDVVLADGSLISTRSATFKNVAGYDLTSLIVGSEGTLGIVVGATVRLRHRSLAVETIGAFFPDLSTAASGVVEMSRAGVQPAITELLDSATMRALDEARGSDLARRGEALLLVQTDGHGASVEAELVREALRGLGAEVTDSGSEEADRLVELRRHARGDGLPDEIRVGEDIAVPRSQLVACIEQMHDIAVAHGVELKVVAHAGDGNLHPTFSVRTSGDEPFEQVSARLDAALDDSVRTALRLGGTITGEHGVGGYKLRWLDWEQSPEVIELQRRIKDAFDPAHLLNPARGVL
ncbi:MAG: FAD-linked oxidase C-terminal domain-containing protein [Nesterenkonia sp.]|nr:FAD-linked oxidase C-terminal domain-containing protein [Nesterenkonia sp.]